MAMVPCPECGKQISDQAKSCPGCGRPISDPYKGVDIFPKASTPDPKKARSKMGCATWAFFFIIAFLVFGIVLSKIDRPAEITIASGGVEPLTEKRCKQFIELNSIEHVANETGWTKRRVVSEYKVNLWQKPTPEGKGYVVGKLLPGSRALLIKDASEDYLVKSPYDGSIGWVSDIQVARTLWQDDKEFKPCKP